MHYGTQQYSSFTIFLAFFSEGGTPVDGAQMQFYSAGTHEQKMEKVYLRMLQRTFVILKMFYRFR